MICDAEVAVKKLEEERTDECDSPRCAVDKVKDEEASKFQASNSP